MTPESIALWAGVPAAAAIGAGILATRHPRVQWCGPVISHVTPKGNARRFALTFDDGPNPAATPRLLDLLDEHEARATFFVVGKYVRECPELVRETAARGHQLANHTDTHPHLTWLSRARIREELQRCRESMEEVLRGTGGFGERRWMRPPFGARGPQLKSVVREEGYAGVVTWSVICFDWKPQPAARLIGRLARVGPGDILVLHDGDHRFLNGARGHVIEALAHWLPRWRDAGIEFVTMDEAVAGA
jgi:peptidoglycan/xylan/chitin deacetylase (PgdA/CDA1 family)